VVRDNQFKRDVITVDGLGASGKSALAKELARRLGYGHLNSGLLYRAVALLALQQPGADLTDAAFVNGLVSNHTISLTRGADNSSVVLIDGVDHGDELTREEVSKGASLVARHQRVRDALIDIQRQAFMPDGVVAEGRDMGTTIFPNARVKFFVVARLDVRAQRRYNQLQRTPNSKPLAEIAQELAERDSRDANSSVGTMKQADGAIVIDNSDLPIEQVVARMMEFIA
jgi:cytidylate kinase